jgi:hypothetical protein
MKTFRILLLTVTAAAFIFGCAGGPSPGGGKAGGASGPPLYYGEGRGGSQIEAMNDAKMSAVQKAVIEMVGIASEAANKQKISERIYNTGNANNFVKNETMQILRREQQGDVWNMEIMIAVDLYTVERTLRDAAVYGNKVTPGSELGSGAVGAKGSPAPAGTAAGTDADQTEGTKAAAAEEDETYTAPEPTPEQRNFINKYIENMRYMVYFDEESAQDPFLMKSAVGMANSYLAGRAIQAVDYEQIEKIKEDQQMAYEEQTGMEISIIQWIAQKLNADVYIELDAETSGETEGGKHYGKAMITLKIFESSTGNLLGSVPYTSPRTFSTASQMDAVNNALQSSIYKAMPPAMEQVKSYMQKALRDGIVYDLVVQNTPDPKLMSDFRRKLKRKVSELRTLSGSAEETKYQVSFFGTIEDLEDLVYDVSESVPGLEGMYRVYFRGKSITFDTGLY